MIKNNQPKGIPMKTHATILKPVTGLILVALFAFSMFVQAQTFSFKPKELTHTGAVGDRIGCKAEVKNLMAQKHTIKILRMRNQLPNDWSSSFCLNQCYAPFTDEVDEDIPANATLEFTMYFDTDLNNEGTGEVDMRLSSMTNPGESYDLTFTAITKRTTSVSDNTPTQFALQQNFPNPFNPTTTIEYSVPKIAHISLRVYDLLGREVKSLVNASRVAGSYRIVWDGKNNSGEIMPSGYYLYKMQTGNFTATKRMMLMK